VPQPALATNRDVLVDVIRWDAWYGKLPETARPPASVSFPGFDGVRNRLVSQNPGRETRLSLAAEPWRNRWPFFTSFNADGTVDSFNESRPEIIQREIDDALYGELDYWAFTVLRHRFVTTPMGGLVCLLSAVVGCNHGLITLTGDYPRREPVIPTLPSREIPCLSPAEMIPLGRPSLPDRAGTSRALLPHHS